MMQEQLLLQRTVMIMPTSLDGQVRLVRLVCLVRLARLVRFQTDNSVCFFINKRKNEKFPFVQ